MISLLYLQLKAIWMQFRYWNVGGFLMLVCGLLLSGFGEAATAYPLNEELARSSVQKAMQSWVDGKAPADLKPDIIVGDQAWEKGRRLTAFKVLSDEETTDGSNLHIRVLRTFDDKGVKTESRVTYIVGTTPVVTIFPQ
jgi:hypothetical protein